MTFIDMLIGVGAIALTTSASVVITVAAIWAGEKWAERAASRRHAKHAPLSNKTR